MAGDSVDLRCPFPHPPLTPERGRDHRGWRQSVVPDRREVKVRASGEGGDKPGKSKGGRHLLPKSSFPYGFLQLCSCLAISRNPRPRKGGRENPHARTMSQAHLEYPHPGIKRHPARESYSSITCRNSLTNQSRNCRACSRCPRSTICSRGRCKAIRSRCV